MIRWLWMTTLKKASIEHLNILPWCFDGGDEEIRIGIRTEHLPAVSQMYASTFCLVCHRANVLRRIKIIH
jgi:hypothetical protein